VREARNDHLSKSILDAGRGYLGTDCAHKAVWAGRRVVLVDPASTAQTCSHRGRAFVQRTLMARWIANVAGLPACPAHEAAGL
jgi:transposase